MVTTFNSIHRTFIEQILNVATMGETQVGKFGGGGSASQGPPIVGELSFWVLSRSCSRLQKGIATTPCT